jgi:hypothetical protein
MGIKPVRQTADTPLSESRLKRRQGGMLVERITIRLALAVLTILLCVASKAAEVSWLTGNSSPTRWALVPTEPNEMSVIHFSGPTKTYVNRTVAEQELGGKPVLQVDPVARKIELLFVPPATSGSDTFWGPVCGLKGSFGPLEGGQWQFFCTRSGVVFSLPFTVAGAGDAPVARYYVDARATGVKNGSNWTNAFTRLQDALAVAQAGSEIRVAKGVYRPDEPDGSITIGPQEGVDPNDFNLIVELDPTEVVSLAATFALKSGVVVKGGYAGKGAHDPNRRDLEAYETILTGDLGGNDGSVAHPYDMVRDQNRADNCYHVVSAIRVDATAVLDGFTITGGQAFGSNDPNKNSCGGGLYIDEGSPIIRDCLILGNAARYYGAGVYTRSQGSPALVNCVIADNWSEWWGGGLFNHGSDLALERCLISGNGAVYYGGGIHNHTNGELAASNCILSGNMAAEADAGLGGALSSYSATARLNFCTFAGNVASGGSSLACDSPSPSGRSTFRLYNCILWDSNEPVWNNDQSTLEIAYSDVRGGWAGQGNINADPCFVESGHWDPGGTPDELRDDTWNEGNYRLRWNSPCVDAGDPLDPADANGTDFAGGLRRYGPAVDMGAYELKDEAPIAQADPDAAGFLLTGTTGSVTLDGTASWDPEGMPLSYQWSRDGQVVSTEAKFTTELPLGEYTFTLVVNDGRNDSTPTDVHATVTQLVPAKVMVSPSQMSRGGGNSVVATLILPKGKRPSDLDKDERLLLFPGGIKAHKQSAFLWFGGNTLVLGQFDRAALMKAVPTNGYVELRIVGKLRDGQFVSGTDTVRIK